MSGATPLFPHMPSWHTDNFTRHRFSIFCRSTTTQNFRTPHQVVLLCSHFISLHSHYAGTTNNTKLRTVTVKRPLRGRHSNKFDKIYQRVSKLAVPEHQQMQLYAVKFIPLLGSLYMFRVFYTPIIRSTIFNCIYSHWYKP